jgi:hypothetical protein
MERRMNKNTKFNLETSEKILRIMNGMSDDNIFILYNVAYALKRTEIDDKIRELNNYGKRIL